MAAIQAILPNMAMEFIGASRCGSVVISGPSLASIISQAPDLKDLHYLLVECKSSGSPQPDSVKIEFGSLEGGARLHSFKGWFRRIQDWDVRVTAQSASSSEADRLLSATMSVLRGHKISAAPVLAISLAPAVSEILALAVFVAVVAFDFDPSRKIFALSLILIFYWRIAFFLVPRRAYIHLRARSGRIGGIFRWSPSARAQALWTVAGGFAGLVALVISIFAWLAPKS
ncbi:hypothetical protein ACWCQL_28585 [Streptomyces sp. NPDC002073]